MVLQSRMDYSPLIDSSQLQSDTSHSVGLLWTSDRTVAETSTWQHTTLTRDKHACIRRDSYPQSQHASGRRPTPRPRSHCLNYSPLCSAFGKSLCTYKKCWKWCIRASIQAWTRLIRLILFAKAFCRFAFGKSLCTYKSYWKWCTRASIHAWTSLISFANTFSRPTFGKSLCTYRKYWKWSPRAPIQDWTSLILFPNTFSRPTFGKLLCTYRKYWKWSPRASIHAWTCIILFVPVADYPNTPYKTIS
jgi:hypothetical protein